jgi:hypothetical protein
MKKTLILGALLAGSLSAFSQGTIFYLDGQVDMTIHIFAPSAGGTFVDPITGLTEVAGDQGAAGNGSTGGVTSDLYYNNAADGNQGGQVGGNATTATTTTGGTTVYTGGAIGNTLTSGATPAGLYNYNNGSDYTVQLWAAPGENAAASLLQPVTQYTTTISTSSTKGGLFKNINVIGDPGIPGTSGGMATIALVAWYNGGTGLTYAAALAAGDPVGTSPLDNLGSLGGVGGPPAGTTADLLGLESFSLALPVPEPSTIALGVIGASTLLFRRRK